MRTIKVELKQHTPLIHFQPEEPGATLRASEVKPKLDRFIIEKIGKGNYEEVKSTVKNNYKQWFIDKADVYALNYKMRIETSKVVCIKNIEGYFGYDKKNRPLPSPMFFGNMQNSENQNSFIKKKFSFCGKLNLIIISYNDKLKDIINDHIEEFFLCSNFGARQSKGYGSFTIIPENNKELNLPYPYFNVKGDQNRLFKEMELFYKAIRSGINQCWGQKPFYLKSLMFAYAKKKGMQWEKKTIKSTIYDESINKKELKTHPNSDLPTHTSKLYIFKDCLGLSKTESWLRPYIDSGSILKYDRQNKINIHKKSDLDCEGVECIQRMKSPITLKPIQIGNNEYRVYIIYKEIDEQILGQKFYVGSDNEELTLSIYPEFKIKEYIDFIVDCDIQSLIFEGTGTETARTIVRIFKELKSSYKKQ